MSKSMRVILLVGIFLVIYASLGMLYWRQQPQQEVLREQIRVAQRVIALRTAQNYAELKAEYDKVQQLVPAQMQTSDVISAIVGLAQAHGIDTQIDSGNIKIETRGGAKPETIGKTKYSVLAFSMQVKGDYKMLLSFIDELSSGKALQTLMLRRVEVKQGEEVSDATIDFVIYTKG